MAKSIKVRGRVTMDRLQDLEPGVILWNLVQQSNGQWDKQELQCLGQYGSFLILRDLKIANAGLMEIDLYYLGIMPNASGKFAPTITVIRDEFLGFEKVFGG